MKTNLPPAFTDRLAELVAMLRNRHVPAGSDLRWSPPLVKTAIDKLCNDGVSPADIGVALFHAADNLTMRSPVTATGPGPQWADTNRAGAKVSTPCPEHPDTPMTKCHCQRVAGSTKPEPDRWARLVGQGRQLADYPTPRTKEH